MFSDMCHTCSLDVFCEFLTYAFIIFTVICVGIISLGGYVYRSSLLQA